MLPLLAMSVTVTPPLAYAIALGGVAAGNIKQSEHAIVTGRSIYKGFIHNLVAS